MVDETGNIPLALVLVSPVGMAVAFIAMSAYYSSAKATPTPIQKMATVVSRLSNNVTAVQNDIQSQIVTGAMLIALSSVTRAKAEPISIPKTPPKNQIIFPVNPLAFNPRGLRMDPRPTPNNGMVINWFDSNGTLIFRWDEDIANSPHYHVVPLSPGDTGYEPHHWPLTAVPEPFATIYFR